MEPGARGSRADVVEEVAGSAVRWMLNTGSKDWDGHSLYHGRAGILVALEEARTLLG